MPVEFCPEVFLGTLVGKMGPRYTYSGHYCYDPPEAGVATSAETHQTDASFCGSPRCPGGFTDYRSDQSLKPGLLHKPSNLTFGDPDTTFLPALDLISREYLGSLKIGTFFDLKQLSGA